MCDQDSCAAAQSSACCLPSRTPKLCVGPDGVYEDDDLDDEEYYPEDEVDPDNMTYEVRRDRWWLLYTYPASVTSPTQCDAM